MVYLADCVSTPVSVCPSGLASMAPEGLAVAVEQLVGEAGLERELPDRHARPGRDVHVPVVLHDPAALDKLPVDLLAGFLFGSHGINPWFSLNRVGKASTSPDFSSTEG